MAINSRKRYFHIDENASSEQIYALLDDVESAEKDDINNLINDSDTAASTQDFPLTTPEANLHVVPNGNQSKKNQNNKKEELWKWNKKVKITK